jgi:hypothetical protein
MSRDCRLYTPVLAIVLYCPVIFAADSGLKPILIEGTWTHYGSGSIIGSGTDTTVIIKRDGDRWTIAYELTPYPSVNDRDARPRTDRQGPFEVAVEDQELVVTKEPGKLPARYTFLCDAKRLILPAIVQKRPGEWAFRSDRESLSVRCEADPFKVPIGKAQVPGVLLGKAFYCYEEAPQSRFWPSAQYLRFLQRSDEKGQLCEKFRLIFDEYGSPRYERLLGTGERSTNQYQPRIHVAPGKPE